MNKSLDMASPLRYPGGKSRVTPFLTDILLLNNLEGSTFYELYAGGAGAALNLLYKGVVENIVINDYDIHIYSFWMSVIHQTDRLLKLIHDTPVNVDVWQKQRNIYENHELHTDLEVGFSTFYLNRCNRSGILYKAGPIGGKGQNGNYKIDVRFNKIELSERIIKIAKYGERIKATRFKTKSYLPEIFSTDENQFVFLDPPYYNQGENLYLNFYHHDDHEQLMRLLSNNHDKNFFLTYDNCDAINDIYSKFRRAELPMSYTLQSKRKSKEVMIFPNALRIPKSLRIRKTTLPLQII